MLLTSPEEVLRLMGAAPLGDSLESAEASLQVTTVSLGNALDTPLELATRQDSFSFRPSKYDTAYQPITLILKQGFLVTTPTVFVSDGTFIPTTVTGTSWSLSTDFIYNPEKGTVTLLSQPPKGSSQILVAYEAGFTGDDDTAIPGWLTQAALREAVSQMQSSVIGYNRKTMRDKSGFLDRAARRLLDDHYRPRFGVHPDSSTVVS